MRTCVPGSGFPGGVRHAPRCRHAAARVYQLLGSSDHIPGLALFTLGCLAIARGNNALFAGALALAALNRETAVFLVALFAVGGQIDRRRACCALAFAAEVACILAGIGACRGWHRYDYRHLWRNLESLKFLPPPYDPYCRRYAYSFLAILGPSVHLGLLRGPQRPVLIRRALWVTVPFVGAVLLISSMIWTRVLTPLLPMLLPAVVSTVARVESAGAFT